MAQQTALSVLGTPGRTQTFIAKIEAEVVAVVTIGAGKKDNQPTSELISPLDYRRGWKEHVRAVEQTMWAKQSGVEQARKVKVQEERIAPKQKPKGIQTPKRERAVRPDSVNRLESNREEVDSVRRTANLDRGIQKPPSEKSLPPKRASSRVVRKPIGRLEELRQQRQSELQQKNVAEVRRTAEKKIEQEIAADEKARLGIIDNLLSEELAASRIAQSKRRKTSLVNLELAREAKKKARAAKKRNAKRKKK